MDTGAHRNHDEGVEIDVEMVREALESAASEAEARKIRARVTDGVTQVIGVRMGTVFEVAKRYATMPLAEVERLLTSNVYELKMVGVSVLDFRARAKDADREALYDVWMRHLDLIDTWDYIDRAAPRVIGTYLLDRPRDVLFELASSPNRWHRRIAVTAAFSIIRARDLGDPLALCEILADDPEHLVQTNVGVALREIGRVDAAVLEKFLTRRGGDLSAHARRTALSALRQ